MMPFAFAVALSATLFANDTLMVRADGALRAWVGRTVSIEGVVQRVERAGEVELLTLKRDGGAPLVTVQSPDFGGASAMLERFSPGDGIIVTGTLAPAGTAFGRDAYHILVFSREAAQSVGLSRNERLILLGAGVLLVFMSIVAIAMIRRSRATGQLLGRGKARAEAQLRSVFAAMSDIVMVLGRNGEYLEVPTTAAAGLLQPWRELVGRNIRDVLPAPAAEEVQQVITSALGSPQPVHYDYALPVNDRIMSFSACVTRLDDDAVVWVARDVTAQRELEAQLLEARKLESIAILAAGVAHDFNNILTVIGAHASFLVDALPESDERREDAAEIARSSERAAALTRELLAFGRKQMLQPVAVDLNDALLTMRATLATAMPNVDVRLECARESATVLMDFAQLEHVMTNLALNARDAMAGQGVFTIALSIVSLDASGAQAMGLREGRHVRLRASDTGSGMEPAVLARVFDPFFTTKGLGRGTGLGLAAVHGIIRQSGGYISASSQAGKGTTFEILFPLAESARLDNTPTAPLLGAGTETILVAEDEPALRSAARRILARHGYHILEAADGRDAVEVATRYPDRIDLLLTDCVMPHVSGPELARELGASRPGIAVLFMSGFTENATVREAVVSSGAQLMEKPFTTVSLLAAVRASLDARRTVAEASAVA
jgi:PAS domain S-box-containing protein